jgi:hypothetical protein
VPYKKFAVTKKARRSWLAVSFWDVGRVARDPCHSIGHLYDPGPTVDDLVGALRAQSTRDASSPTRVTLAGYAATYLEWSVPADLTVRRDVWGVPEWVGCDVQANGHREFVSWESRGAQGVRWQQMAGQVDRLWILDVNGQRLVVDASHSPNATPAQLHELDQIVQSLRFVSDA